jgi:hypothetical protein
MRVLTRPCSRSAALLLTLGFALASCGAPPVRRADVPDFGEVKVLFAVGQDEQIIHVRALDRLAIASATLILPGGERIPADSIEQLKNPSFSDRTSLGAPSSDVEAVGGGVPLLTGPGMAQTTTTFIGQIASVAQIRVPDLREYRQIWQGAKVEVQLGIDPSDRRTELLPAPSPQQNPT